MRRVNVQELDFDKGNGLIPVVTQDATSKEVLMVAYANRQSVEATLETGYAHYWSRSRQELWKKGATSGHLQTVREVVVDCDNDTLLYLIDQIGPACHTGERSCFHRQLTGNAQD
jgi:phosphoribosyl-AMP cyclohydrolase